VHFEAEGAAAARERRRLGPASSIVPTPRPLMAGTTAME